MKTILVAGGAGYIGSCATRTLIDNRYNVVILDNLSTGHSRLLHPKASFIRGDLRNPSDAAKAFAGRRVDCVMHFAAAALVGESVENPAKYYENNVLSCIHLLAAMKKSGVKDFIFSSTCATYGEPVKIPMSEAHPNSPANPYGRSKLMIDWMLKDLADAGQVRFISLRYFNACGAHASGIIGEMHDPETHLIPNVLRVASGRKKKLTIFGDDFDTPDGTCVRDYIHVEDIADAHVLALRALSRGVKNEVFNLGTEKGFSNLEILKTAEKITGKKINYKIGPRRPGDPSRLIADSSKVRKILGWKPKRGLEEILGSAWQWEKKSSI